MSTGLMILLLASALTLVGLCWALPWGQGRRRAPGWVLVGSGLVMMASLIPPFGGFLARILLWGMTVVTLGAAVAMITTVRPLYSALWFGLTVMGTAGLLLFHGAQFVSIALIVVYVGAILVVFLFLIMLDEPPQQPAFNRQSWEPFVASLAGVILLGLVTGASLEGYAARQVGDQAAVSAPESAPRTFGPTSTAALGKELFGYYAMAIEVAGLLLLLALVGAAVIISRPLEPLTDLTARVEGEMAGDGAGMIGGTERQQDVS